MLVTLASPPGTDTGAAEQRFMIGGIRWDSYLAISDALDDHCGVRLIYNEGRLTLLGTTRRHEWLAESLGYLVLAVAARLHIDCEPAGKATYRQCKKEAGAEGDRTFHFSANAKRMQGMENYDFEVDPPPDLAIEVEVSHPADDAIGAWGRLGVAEVWRFEAAAFTCTFWNRRDDDTYEQVLRSKFLPALNPSDVVEQMSRAREVGTSKWLGGLEEWVREVLRPRLDGGAA